MEKTPIDFLKSQTNKTIEIFTLNNKKYAGELVAIDSLANVHLINTFEYEIESNECVFLGETLINGGNVALFNFVEL